MTNSQLKVPTQEELRRVFQPIGRLVADMQRALRSPRDAGTRPPGGNDQDKPG